MLPSIRAVVCVEMLRDGGSLQVEFIGTNGSTYCLHFQLVSEIARSGNFVRLGYERPMVFERLKIREENRIEWQAINQVEVSWTHATVLLHQLRAFMKDDTDSKWFAAMEEIAETAGEIPGDILHIPEPGRHLFSKT